LVWVLVPVNIYLEISFPLNIIGIIRVLWYQ